MLVHIGPVLNKGLSSVSIIFAYLDAGTGSLIIQAVVGGVAAAGVTFRFWIGRVKKFFRRGGSDATSPVVEYKAESASSPVVETQPKP